jgi:hypothetical protein
VWTVGIRLLDSIWFSIEDVGASIYLHGLFCGLGGAGALVAFSYAPFKHKPSTRVALMAGGGLVVVGTFMFSMLAYFSVAVVVGAVVAIVMAEMLPENAPVSDRLVVSLGAMASMLFVALALPVILGFLPLDFARDLVGMSLVQTIVALVSTRLVLWGVLRANANADPARTRAASVKPPQNVHAWPAAPVAPPPGWFWGKIHDRASGTKALGYRYTDPVGGTSFHIVADLAAIPPAHVLHEAGYRGQGTFRLGAHETMYIEGLPADVVAFQHAAFDEGGAAGTVIMALTTAEKQALGLPEAPPWIGHYLPRAA